MYYRKMARDLYKLIYMELVYSIILPFFNVSKICTFQQNIIDLHVAEILNKLCLFVIATTIICISYFIFLFVIYNSLDLS